MNALFVQLMFCLQDIMDMAAYRSAMVFRLDPGEHKRSKARRMFSADVACGPCDLVQSRPLEVPPRPNPEAKGFRV